MIKCKINFSKTLYIKLLLQFPKSKLFRRQEAVTQYEAEAPQPQAEDEGKDLSLLQKRSLHSQSTGRLIPSLVSSQ